MSYFSDKLKRGVEYCKSRRSVLKLGRKISWYFVLSYYLDMYEKRESNRRPSKTYNLKKNCKLKTKASINIYISVKHLLLIYQNIYLECRTFSKYDWQWTEWKYATFSTSPALRDIFQVKYLVNAPSAQYPVSNTAISGTTLIFI